jgi:lipopolysaccharide transport system ATP-binding protein
MAYGMLDLAKSFVGRCPKTAMPRRDEFWALEDVEFDLKPGEGVGLLGPNGSGKTTLLRLISGIFPPDKGEISVHGRIGALIALGAGFHPHMTGRENIYLNGVILGMSRREIDVKYDEIVSFADIPDFLDAPVATYSSGMKARLGFAIAISIDPDILLVDEVLAVGDIRFRSKCYQRIAVLRKAGTAVVLVSHNPLLIQHVCERSVYLSGGKVKCVGPTDDVIRKFQQDMDGYTSEISSGELRLPEKGNESSGLDLVRIGFYDKAGNLLPALETGTDVTLRLACKARRPIHALKVSIACRSVLDDAQRLLTLTSSVDGFTINFETGTHEVILRMFPLGLVPGDYHMKVTFFEGAFSVLDGVEDFRFSVRHSSNMLNCVYYQPHAWSQVRI